MIKRLSFRQLPGPASKRMLDKMKLLNGGWNDPYPFIHSGKGEGSYFKDIDGNTYLDFSSQIATNPLGYNHPDLCRVLKQYAKHAPVKFAGQDFYFKEHKLLLESLLSTAPKEFQSGFLINSGAEAVENAIKVALRRQQTAKFGVSFHSGFHGRTLGALSCTNSKRVQKQHYFTFPMQRLPFSTDAVSAFERLLMQEACPADVGFVILEHVQGEGGYNIADPSMAAGISRLCRRHNIPFIADEVQSGVGRTGKWWAFQHYASRPDIFTSAKALQVGAVAARKPYFPLEPGAISSTWGGGHVLDLALGIETIAVIKRDHLLSHIRKRGDYLHQCLVDFNADHCSLENIRGLGLMRAFDLPSKKVRDNFILQMLKHGVVLLGCGQRGVRLLPSYTISEDEIDTFMAVLEQNVKKVCDVKFKHTGEVCKYLYCGRQR